MPSPSLRQSFGMISALLCCVTWVAMAAADGGAALPLPTLPIPPGGGAPSPPPPSFTLRSAVIPADGALLLIGESNSQNASVTVTDAQNMPVAGMLQPMAASQQLYTWKPAAALTVGQTYNVQVLNATYGYSQSYSFQAVAALGASAPTISATPALTTSTAMFNTQCCTMLPGAARSMVSCFPTTEQVSANLQLPLTSSDDDSLLSQFVFNVVADPNASSTPTAGQWAPLYASSIAANVYGMQATQYCISLQLMNIVTQQAMPLTSASPACLAHGSLPMLGMNMFDPITHGSLAHSQCQLPPSTLTQSWCTVNASCSGMRDAPGCEGFGYVCLGEPMPVDPTLDAGSAGSAGTLGQAGGAGSGVAGSGAAGTASGSLIGDNPSSGHKNSGCSVGRVHGSASDSDSWAALFLFAGACVWRTRRGSRIEC